MSHHKKRRHSNARAGCKMCKPWKANGCKHEKYNRLRQDRVADIDAKEQIRAVA